MPFKPSLVLIALIAAGLPSITSAQSPAAPVYFRSDLGIAEMGAGPLPNRFDAPELLRWRTPTDSGSSTPTLAAGKIFLTTYRAKDKELATLAINAENGQLLWKQIVPVERVETVHPTVGNPAVATPICDGEKLYVFFGSYGLLCYDLNGKKLWEQRLGPFQDEYGAGSSPILVDDKIILCQDHDVDSFLMAVDRYTGKPLWKVARPDAVRSYSTPSVWTVNGRKELLVAGALELAGFDPANGEKLWWVNGLARIVIPTPVPHGDTVFMAAWTPGGDTAGRVAMDPWSRALEKWDRDRDGKLTKAEVTDAQVVDRYYRIDLDQSGALNEAEWNRHADVFRRAQNIAIAVKPAGRGDLTDKAIQWKHAKGTPYVATPLVHNGVFWMVKDGGIVTKLDAKTGELLKEERLPAVGNYYASPVTGDGKVYFAGEQGVVSVVADDRAWNVLSSHKFDAKIYATPVIHRNRIYIRTEEALYCFEGGKAAK